jgi:hypothetical protein
VDGGEGLFRVTEGGAELRDVGKPELDAEGLEREQPVDCAQV